MISEKQTISFF